MRARVGWRLKTQRLGASIWEIEPGEAAYPQRFVYLASESKPPACVADVLAIEHAARKREEPAKPKESPKGEGSGLLKHFRTA